jgi:putative ABC transport system permease protein
MHGRYCISRMESSQTEQVKKNNMGHQPWTGDREKTENGQQTAAFSLWLSWQELNGRKVVLIINVILIALLIALPVSLDFIGKARKNSVDTRVDYIGPSLILAPQGILSSDLSTAKLRGRTFSSSLFNSVRSEFSQFMRHAEARLTTRLSIEGRDMPVAGMDFQNLYSYPFRKYSVGHNETLLGRVAADKLRKNKGETLQIHSQRFTVAGIIPTTGGIDDASVFISLSVLQGITRQEGRINEVRLFPESSASYEELKIHLQKYNGQLNLIDVYRGDTAEKDIDSTLFNYQKALYTVAFILIALCIMISTYINLDGRKTEVSTVYTLGVTQGIILQLLTFRTIWITLLGSLAGHVIALLIATLQDHRVPIRFIWSTGSFIEVILGTIVLGTLVTIPFALYSVYKRDLISHL